MDLKFWVERQYKVRMKVPKRKKFLCGLFCSLERISRLLCFATWNGPCHHDLSSILCYFFVGCVNNMEKLLMSSEELKWWVLCATNCSFKNTFSRKLVQDKNAQQPWITQTVVFNLPLSQAAWQFWWGAKSERNLWEQILWCFMILIRYCIKEKNIMNTSTYTFYFPSNINS